VTSDDLTAANTNNLLYAKKILPRAKRIFAAALAEGGGMVAARSLRRYNTPVRSFSGMAKAALMALDGASSIGEMFTIRGEQKMKAMVFVLFAGMVGIVQPVSAGEPARYSETVLHSFGNFPDGQQPYAGVIDVKGVLYGTTFSGGSEDGAGTVFALDLKTGAEKVLSSNFNYPEDSLIDVNGTLYGTTSGQDSAGTVFALDLNTDAERTLYTFNNLKNGYEPVAGLIDVKGTLYGTTLWGGNVGGDCGDTGCGTAFSRDLKTGVEKVLYSFCSQPDCADGEEPWASLIDVNGVLYGTTSTGGSADCDGVGCGTVFSLDPKTGAEKVLHSFGGGSDGATPQAGLIDVNGLLYGTTSYGGVGDCNGSGTGCGTAFSLDPNTGAEKVVYAFCIQTNCTDGAEPGGVINVNGKLYGTTFIGGNGTGCDNPGCGTAFSLDPNTGAEKVFYSFCSQPNCADGAYPERTLIDVKGTFYDTTGSGGAYNYGTVFMLKKAR